MSEHHEVVIVGSGPAGLTAAVYTARANLEPVVVEGLAAGGQLMLTTDVENYPGFPDGIMGPELMTRFREQAERFGTRFITADADAVDLSSRPFRVTVGDLELTADAVIISTGAIGPDARPRVRGRLLGHGVSTCATCDGFFFRDHEIAVVGGGDSAIEEANFLTKFASKVTLIHRRDELRASKIMQDRAFANPKIEFRWNSEVIDALGDDKLTGIRLRDTVTGEESELAVTGLFVAIGHIPNTVAVHRPARPRRERLHPHRGRLDPRHRSTGVFACGDVQDHTYRQAITAAGSGCMAAIETERYLESTSRHARACIPDPGRLGNGAPGDPRWLPSVESQDFESPERSLPWPRTSSPCQTQPSMRASAAPRPRSWWTSGPSGADRAR